MLIYDTAGPPNPAGRTHALVIGVGRYPHVNRAGDRDLSSAAVSAVEFASWLAKGGCTNPSAPLATIELVLTPADGQSSPWAGVETATLANVQRAFDAWFARCDASPDNVAIFYFAGHGLWYDEAYLLAEDFDPDHPMRPWGGVFSMEKTHNGLARCRATYQLCLVEACQGLPPDLFGTPSIQLPGLIERATKPSAREAPIIYASRPKEQAYGKPGEVASFTKAVMHVLGGAGAKPTVHDTWQITTAELTGIGEVLRSWAELERVPDQEPQFVISGGRPLAEFAKPPEVEAFVKADAVDLARCALEMRSADTSVTVSKPPRTDTKPWQVLVPKGFYFATAREENDVRCGPKAVPLYAACPVVVLP